MWGDALTLFDITSMICNAGAIAGSAGLLYARLAEVNMMIKKGAMLIYHEDKTRKDPI